MVEQRIRVQLERAWALGLKAEGDLFFFVLNGLVIADHWHEHPDARRCIERAGREGLSLAELMAELTDDVRHAIKYHGAARC